MFTRLRPAPWYLALLSALTATTSQAGDLSWVDPAVAAVNTQVIDLRQGPIAFPVGTELLIEDLMGVYEGARPRMFQGTVTHSDGLGMSIEI